jgi:hypothetical protein
MRQLLELLARQLVAIQEELVVPIFAIIFSFLPPQIGLLSLCGGKFRPNQKKVF